MVCDVIWDQFGPFMAFKEDLLALDSSLSSDLMFTDFFLKLRSKGQSIFSCPDVMFHTKKGPFNEVPSRNEWLQLAKKWQLHAISIEMGPLKIHQFSCDEIGVTCNAEKQAQFYIVPWCCLQAAYHVNFCHKKEFQAYLQLNVISFRLCKQLTMQVKKLVFIMNLIQVHY